MAKDPRDHERPQGGSADEEQATDTRTLVCIDAREAIVVSWLEDRAQVERLESDPPDPRRSTGHVRYSRTFRHGGGGAPQTAGEPHRAEHLNRFVDQVAEHLPAEDDLLIMGPGTTRERLERGVRKLGKFGQWPGWAARAARTVGPGFGGLAFVARQKARNSPWPAR